MKAAIIYPHPTATPSGATLRLNQLIAFLAPRVEALEVFLPDPAGERVVGNVRYLSEPYVSQAGAAWLDFAPATDPDASPEAALGEVTLQLLLLAKQRPNPLGILGISSASLDILWSFYRLFAHRKIMATIREMVARADVVFIEYPHSARWIAPLCRAAGALSIVTAHDVLAKTSPDEGAIISWIWEMEKQGMRAADRACAVSPVDAAFFTRAGVPTETVIGPIDCHKAGAPPDPEIVRALRDKYQLEPEGRPTALFVGGSWFINQDAVRSINEMRSTLPDCTFVLAGGCAPAGRVGNLLSLGILSEAELQALYHLVTVVVVPIRGGTGSSTKFIEAMAHGKPILSTGIGSRPYPVKHDREVVLAEVSEFPARLNELLADPARRERLGRAAADFVQPYHFEKVFETYWQWMEEHRVRSGK